MKVSEAIKRRKSCRSFLKRAVELKSVKWIISTAGRSASGGNLQPWHVFVMTGEDLKKMIDRVKQELKCHPRGHTTEYNIYPPDLEEPYRTRRFKCGEDLYQTLGIRRDEKERRRKQFLANFELFGAPVCIFIFVDRKMGPPQWSDVGMFLQNILLLAKEDGLDTCAQEAWAVFHRIVQKHTGAPQKLMLFCGVALGYRDERHPINTLRTEREPLEKVAKFIGF